MEGLTGERLKNESLMTACGTFFLTSSLTDLYFIEKFIAMKSTIGVYPDHESAITAVNALKAAGFPQKQISILGHAADEEAAAEGVNGEGPGMDSDDAFSKPAKVAARTMGISLVVGPILGALAGIGLLAIPGLGMIVGAGALAGAVAGLDAGLIGGGIISAIQIAGISKEHEQLYHEHLSQGRYLVIAQGTDEEISQARSILQGYNRHLLLESHG